jgi:hypothetical protein
MEDEKSSANENEPQQKNEETKEVVKSTKPKRKVLRWVLITIGVLLLIPIFYAGWLGFIPGLSQLMGANNPVDLGVTYTEQDLQEFYTKTGQEVKDYNNAPLDPSMGEDYRTIFADPEAMDLQVTQEEITARINNDDWIYMPMTNVQVRLGEGNSIEVSGNVDVDALEGFIPFIGGVGYSQEDVDTGLSWLKRMAGSPAVYINSTGSISNNVLDLTINEVKIGRWNAPISEATDVLTTATENALRGTIGLDVESATFGDGYIDFVGTAPTTIYELSN